MAKAISCTALLLLLLLSFFDPVCAADPPNADTAKTEPMKLDEPMAGGMKKPGMKKGDVKKAAEKKDREMRDKLEKEQRSAGTVKK
jgi:pentapeptide MXKDX repeat protein